MDEIRYGIIGAGMMGLEHFRDLQALDGAVVTATCSMPGSSTRSSSRRRT